MESVTNFLWSEASKSDLLQDVLGADDTYVKDPNKPSSGGGVSTGGIKSRDDSGIDLNGVGSLSNAGLQKMMTDALVEKLMKMALPPATEMGSTILEQRIEFSKDRPRLSVPVMSRNFILSNARFGLPFTMVDEVIYIFSWLNPAYTLSILIIYSFIILKPLPSLLSIPIFYILFGVMVPQYLYIHKPETLPYFDSNPTPAQGPPLRKPAVPEPASELSQEFVLNLTDLQNHMLIYVRVYDFFAKILGSFAFFTDEAVSAMAFLILLSFALMNCLFIDTFVNYIPYKHILLFLGWAVMFSFHPINRDRFLGILNSEETRLRVLTVTNKLEELMNNELKTVEASERKLVAVYEIQKLGEKSEWVPIGFSNDSYTLFSTLRINEQKIERRCASHLEEVMPPIDWEWVNNSKWVLDLEPTEWVERNFVQFVEIDSETKWVYDVNIDGNRGSYRRRMWTNLCTRKKEDAVNKDNNEFEVEEVVNPLRDDNYSHDLRGVSKKSFTGLSNQLFGKANSSHNKFDSISSNEGSDAGKVPGTENVRGDSNTSTIGSSKAMSSLNEILSATL
ncbi:hypothetical protein Kpol_1018p66 [Vanderwaltozyma polyspora DSM 70294]|uniref:TECPR1-like DysF domain-containing protein n=1 Tax=Vanderwaltozyma polyspora (strain ATCC 22028 / DSM 70294 / BCRC 21397 / CBS 2163 / NBRC 10782 / NRRL Y-8283 / UCD 57-17) TaxID=436907 RepID=A7TDR4_VANPO|nr:uncharacterized protein Kpol_1018p66 [Vanderwaltozyma polyspora DSM 70294]EDO19534.1 hypothetical protein Kpol_1018p66 [Vanderwaltozyma polyspora DSM 70294]